jgi:hypothetical protein
MPGVRVVDLSGDETVIGIIELCDPRRELGPEQQFIDFWTSARSAIDAFLAVHSSAFISPQPSTHTRVKRERNNQNIPPISDSPPTSQTCSLGSRPEDGECGGETERGRVGGGVRGSYEGPAPGGARNHGKRRNRGGGMSSCSREERSNFDISAAADTSGVQQGVRAVEGLREE